MRTVEELLAEYESPSVNPVPGRLLLEVMLDNRELLSECKDLLDEIKENTEPG